MTWLKPIDAQTAPEEQRKVLERARQKFAIADDAPSPAWLLSLANSPSLLKDVYMNVERSLMKDGPLASSKRLVIATAVASQAGCGALAEYFAQRAEAAGATREQLVEAAAIAATSTSFNHYYKFRSLYEGEGFEGFTPGLRASLFVNPSQGKAMAELINLVISTINGCKSCVNGHVQDALKAEVTREQIDDAIRIGGIVMAICAVAQHA